MNLNLYIILYLVANLFNVYILFKLMQIFFLRSNINKKYEFSTYIVYFLVNSGIALFVRVPILNLLSSVIFIFIITFNYEDSVKKRMLSTVYISLFLLGVEIFVEVLLKGTVFNIYGKNQYQTVIAMFATGIVSYFLIALISNFKKIKEVSLPKKYWLTVIFIPLASMYLFILITSLAGLTKMQLIIVVFIIISINFIALVFYERILNEIVENQKNKFFVQQSRYYEKQFELIQQNIEKTKRIRHDTKNHYISIKYLYNEEELEEGNKYIDSLMEELNSDYFNIRTGNIIVDSILNYKLSEINQNDIELKKEILIPKKLKIENVDLTIILGNLIDNAIEALKKEEKKRKLFIKIKYADSNLMLEMKNTCSVNDVCLKNIKTTKRDKENHGLGIKNVKEVVKKYDGNLDLQLNDGEFIANALVKNI